MADNINVDVRAYVFKRRLLWCGWLLEKHKPVSYLYADNTPYITMEPEVNMKYLVFGLTEKSVNNKIVKYCKKHYGMGGC